MTNRFLQHLYYASDDSVEEFESRNTTCTQGSVVQDFKPFRMERHLCFAGNKSSSKLIIDSKNTPVPETSGFLPCLTTLESERNMKEVPVVDNHCSFDITDSELLDCWQQVDEMLINTPKKRLQLVNSILDDFALSPYTEKSNQNPKFAEYSPEFVLKSKPRITYSSRRRKAERTDCSIRLNFATNDECLSDSSSISVQEYNSQLDEVTTNTVVPDTTERLCENLLNLSAYFSQTSPAVEKCTQDALSTGELEGDDITRELQPTFSNVTSLIQEITSLRSTCSYNLRSYSFNSSYEDFYGFSEVNSDQEGENEKIFLDNRRCASDEVLVRPRSFQKLDEDCELIVDIKAKKDGQFDKWADDCMEIFALIKTPPQSSKKGPKKPMHVLEQGRDNVYVGFKTASSKQIHISKEAHSKAADILKNLPEIITKETVERDSLNGPTNRQVGEKVKIDDRTFKCSRLDDVYDLPSTSKAALKANVEYRRRRNFGDPNSSKVKTISISAKQICAKRNSVSDREILNNSTLKVLENATIREDHTDINLNENKNEIKQEYPLNNLETPKEISNKYSNMNKEAPLLNSYKRPVEKQLENYNIGFQTAKGKNIKPTSKAIKSVEKLLKEFQSDSKHFDENDLDLMKNTINLKQCKQSTSCTRSINVKTENELWEDADLSNLVFSEWPIEDQQRRAANSPKKMQSSIETKSYEMNLSSMQTALNAKLEGFHTAGGKKVPISEKGKKNIENLLQEIKNDCDTNDLLQIKNYIHKKNNKAVVAPKSIKPQNKESSDVREIPTEFEETVNSSKQSVYKHLHITKTNSLTELSVKSPLNVSMANSIIARKNLLSLSKKRKGLRRLSSARVSNANELPETTTELYSDHGDISNKMYTSRNNAATHMLQTTSTPIGSRVLINASKSSTPLSNSRVRSTGNMDNDFKPISWNDNKSASGSSLNTTFNTPKPSVNDRIARLRMYGEAPPISPILTTNFQSSCRSSGLKRTRSMLKKSDNK